MNKDIESLNALGIWDTYERDRFQRTGVLKNYMREFVDNEALKPSPPCVVPCDFLRNAKESSSSSSSSFNLQNPDKVATDLFRGFHSHAGAMNIAREEQKKPQSQFRVGSWDPDVHSLSSHLPTDEFFWHSKPPRDPNMPTCHKFDFSWPQPLVLDRLVSVEDKLGKNKFASGSLSEIRQELSRLHGQLVGWKFWTPDGRVSPLWTLPGRELPVFGPEV